MKDFVERFAGRWRAGGNSLLLVFVLGVLRAQFTFAGPPTVSELVNQFDAANYQNIVSNKLYTRQGMNRLAVTGAHHDLCRDAIYTEFQNAGSVPYKDFFTFQDSNNVTRTACNIIAVKPGVQNPDNEIYIVGSHYDSKSNPGADDNATGVACQLEMARIFNQYHFAKTIVFCIFDAEEIYDYFGAHRLGSVRYAAQHLADNIKGMISVDMIGWQSPVTLHNTANIEGRTQTLPIRTDLAAAIQAYGGGLQVNQRTPGNYSDHVAFVDAGFQACLLIEANWAGNPNYHKATDYVENPGYLDWDYVGRMCKSVIGYYATQLQPVDVGPRIISIQPGTNGSVFISSIGLPQCQYATELCTNLSAPLWMPLQTNTASAVDGSFVALDPQAANRLGGFYRARFVSGYIGDYTPPTEIITDNSAAVVVGSWSTGTSSPDKYGADYRFRSAGTGTAYLEYRPNLPTGGNYRVYEWHPEGTNRTADAPVEVSYNGGTQTVSINQQVNGGTWLLLGTFNFSAGTSGYVRIKDDFTTGSVVLADAVKFVYVP